MKKWYEFWKNDTVISNGTKQNKTEKKSLPDLRRLAQDINNHSGTNVSLNGNIDSRGYFIGFIEGGSQKELTEFIRYISTTRGEDFESIQLRYGNLDPPTYTCHIEFDTNDVGKINPYIITACSVCNQLIEAPEEVAGSSIVCPGCGSAIGIVSFGKPIVLDDDLVEAPIIKPELDISKIYFISSNHKRYNNGKWNGSDNRGNMRAIEVKPDSEKDDSYFVTLYNLSGVHPEWGDNIQIAPKRMKVVSSEVNKITLKGYGDDPMLANRPPQIQSNYGIVIHLKNKNIDHISYYYHDRNVRIDFVK